MSLSVTSAEQREREVKALKTFLSFSLLGSMALHVAVLALGVSHFWQRPPAADANPMEMIVLEPISPEEPIAEPEADPESTEGPEGTGEPGGGDLGGGGAAGGTTADLPADAIAFAPETVAPQPELESVSEA